MRYELRPEAIEDLIAAATYYNSEQPGLGDRFADAVVQALERLKVFPESAPVVIGDNVRRITATPFQFGLFYVVEPDLVDVLRVLHLSRSSANWPE